MKESHELELKRAKEDYKAQLNTLKERFLQERGELNQKIDIIMNESSKLKLNIIDHTNCADIIKKKEKSIEVKS